MVASRRKYRPRRFGRFKIAYSFAQVVSSSVEEFDVAFPDAFSEVVNLLSFANLDLFGFLSVGCLVDVTFYEQLMFACAAPVGSAPSADISCSKSTGSSRPSRRIAA